MKNKQVEVEVEEVEVVTEETEDSDGIMQDGRTFYIFDEITDDFLKKIVVPFMELDKDQEPITIYVNTPGGETSAALCLCRLLDKAESPVSVYLMGYAYSAGMLIAMAGRDNPNVTTYAFPQTMGLIHWGSCYAFEDSVERTIAASDFQRDYHYLLRDYVRSHCDLTEEELTQLVDHRDYYILVDEMLERGIIDVIL